MARTKTLGEQTGLSEEAIQQNRSTPLGGLPCLSTRALNALAESGITRVGRVAQFRDGQLLRIPGFGVACLNSVKDALNRFAQGERRGTLAQEIALSDESIAEVSDTPVAELPGLFRTTRDSLTSGGITTIGELASCDVVELLMVPGITSVSVNTMRHSLTLYVRGERAISPTARAPRSIGRTRQILIEWLKTDPSFPSQLTLDQIGAVLGVSRERVRQILKELGVSDRKHSAQGSRGASGG